MSGKIDMDIERLYNLDPIIIEIISELKDISIRANTVLYGYDEIWNQIGIFNSMKNTYDYIESAYNRTVGIRRVVSDAMMFYTMADQNLNKKFGGTKNWFQKVSSGFNTAKMYTGLLGGTLKVNSFKDRLDEEDYAYCITYYYADGTVQNHTMFHNYERDFVGAKYNTDGEMTSYLIRKQWIGDGDYNEYLFADGSRDQAFRASNVVNEYDGHESNSAKDDVEYEFIENASSREIITDTKITRYFRQDGVYQDLTDWSVKNNCHAHRIC